MQAPTQAQLNALPVTLDQIKAQSNYEPRFAQAGFDGATSSASCRGAARSYNGLALQLTRRFSHGLQMQGAYTWSHNMDNSTATHFSTLLSPRRPQDFRNLNAEWASSALDRRQRLTFTWLYDTPWMSHAR